jgi:ribosomal protein L16 Arg81 hydroxylase
VIAETNETSSYAAPASPAVVNDDGIDTHYELRADDFVENYVRKKRPVLIKGALKETAAFESWTFDRLRRESGERLALLKDWGPSGDIVTRAMKIADYLDEIERFEGARNFGESAPKRPAYLHDVPLTSVFPAAATDLAAFPHAFFPKWYGADWTLFAQFFLGPSTSVTPLHFDCLLTHNLFFQLRGRKRFTVLDHAQIRNCYPYDWRWCAVDPEAPDFNRHPDYRSASPHQILVEPGDIFYMPPGMLHHVRSLDAAMSFNVDWHTPTSAVKGVLAAARGMPLRNVYYNLVVAFGLLSGVSNRRLMPLYRSYLSYVS